MNGIISRATHPAPLRRPLFDPFSPTIQTVYCPFPRQWKRKLLGMGVVGTLRLTCSRKGQADDPGLPPFTQGKSLLMDGQPGTINQSVGQNQPHPFFLTRQIASSIITSN
uniref:Uncharacterized protein n=1 Tax=Globodera rostochiensis TaxID=31243 RepID=A0A914GVL4_GLORO